MRYPEYLKKNGTIGFVAPSFGCNINPYLDAFNNAKSKFEAMGYGLDLGPNCYLGEGVGISNTPKKCGDELTNYYCSENNNVLLSCGGGELMCEILDFVDFDRIREANPKWYMGYSDNTNFTFLLTTLCDTASIYGPCAPSFGMEPWHDSLKDAINLITGKFCGNNNEIVIDSYDKWELESLKTPENPFVPYNLTQKTSIKKYLGYDEVMGNLNFEGRLLGGCMDCLKTLIGTRYDNVKNFCEMYKDTGIIWFLESCELNLMDIRRTMWQMESAGWFKFVKGFIIGRPQRYDEEIFGINQYEAILSVAGKYNVPIAMDADIGHLPPMMPIVTGSLGHVTTNGDKLSLKMKM